MSHRLHYDMAAGFPIAREHEDIRVAVELVDAIPGLAAAKDDPLGNANFRGEALALVLIVTLADNIENDRQVPQALHGPDRVPSAFRSHHPPDQPQSNLTRSL